MCCVLPHSLTDLFESTNQWGIIVTSAPRTVAITGDSVPLRLSRNKAFKMLPIILPRVYSFVRVSVRYETGCYRGLLSILTDLKLRTALSVSELCSHILCVRVCVCGV